MRVLVVDYGAGNLASVIKGLGAVGAEARIARSPQELASASAIVVPGVGHFAATAAIGSDWRAAMKDAIDAGTAVLGICLGMQWLFDGSDEAPDVPGLGVFGGSCVRLSGDITANGPGGGRSNGPPVKVPHVGWNTLDDRASSSALLDGIAHDASAYFTHTFAAPNGPATLATTTHGATTFASVVARGRVCGAQFHPEKSGAAGLTLLANFVRFAQTSA